MADTLCNGIKKRFPSYFKSFQYFSPLSFPLLYQFMGFLFSIIFSPSSLGHARRELRLSFLPCFFFIFLNGFGFVVYYLILAGRGRRKVGRGYPRYDAC